MRTIQVGRYGNVQVQHSYTVVFRIVVSIYYTVVEHRRANELQLHCEWISRFVSIVSLCSSVSFVLLVVPLIPYPLKYYIAAVRCSRNLLDRIKNLELYVRWPLSILVGSSHPIILGAVQCSPLFLSAPMPMPFVRRPAHFFNLSCVCIRGASYFVLRASCFVHHFYLFCSATALRV